MGRPKLHDEKTAVALLDAAERIAEAEGAEALTVRRVADAVGTTTRAVYTVFGSKEALVIALGQRAFDLLRDEIDALPATADPAHDLVEAGVTVFRRFAVDHPALFEIGVLRKIPDPTLAAGYRDAAFEALAGLTARVDRLAAEHSLGETEPRDAVRAFHALCEGLAAMELRSLLPASDEERIWRVALGALVRGFAAPL
jgi:AcrR family transcriptional regulator